MRIALLPAYPLHYLPEAKEIRNQLVLLKTDRSTYLRSQEVIPLYDETIEQVNQLDENLGFAEGSPTTQRTCAPSFRLI